MEGGTEVEKVRQKDKRGKQGERGREDGARAGWRRRASGHFWKEEEAAGTREKEKGGHREGERPEKGGEREESDSDFRQPLQKQ